jgi:hypothetical protein
MAGLEKLLGSEDDPISKFSLIFLVHLSVAVTKFIYQTEPKLSHISQNLMPSIGGSDNKDICWAIYVITNFITNKNHYHNYRSEKIIIISDIMTKRPKTVTRTIITTHE